MNIHSAEWLAISAYIDETRSKLVENLIESSDECSSDVYRGRIHALDDLRKYFLPKPKPVFVDASKGDGLY